MNRETEIYSPEQKELAIIHNAQMEALRWLQSKAEDQLVKAFIQIHKEQLDRIGYPVSASGGELINPILVKGKHQRENLNPLYEQLDIEKELERRNGTQ